MAFPTTGLIDNFNRADELPIAAPWTTPMYSDDGTGPDLFGNQADFNPGAANYNSVYGPNCEVYATVVTLPVGVFTLRARSQNVGGALATASYYESVFDAGDSWLLRKRDAGSLSDLAGPTAFSFTDGDLVGMACIGTSIQVWHKPSAGSWTMLGSVDDAAVSAAGYFGMTSNDGGCNVDDFSGGTVSEAYYTFPILGRGAGW